MIRPLKHVACKMWNGRAAMDLQKAVLPDAPWGVISIKAQDEPQELPMQPITMMRNAYVTTYSSAVRYFKFIHIKTRSSIFLTNYSHPYYIYGAR